MATPIIAPPGSLSAAYALGEERGRESFTSMLIGDTIPPIHAELLRAYYGDITETLMAAYRDGHHSGRKQAGAA